MGTLGTLRLRQGIVKARVGPQFLLDLCMLLL